MLRRGLLSLALLVSPFAGFTAIVASCLWLGASCASAAETEPLAARQQAARNLIQEALQREIYGSVAEREKLLKEAESRDAVSLPARWHQGMVQTPTGDWRRPDDFSLDPKSKTLLSEYRKLRDATADTVLAQLGLANWCAENKLPHQERAHLWRVITIDPEHAEGRRRLGFVLIDNEWFTEEDATIQKRAIEDYTEALARYREPVQEILRDLTHRSMKRQQVGRQKLDELADPKALPAIEEVLGGAGGHISELAIEKIDQFEGQDASLALCRFALLAPHETLRKLAADKLSRRDKNDYVPLLLDLLSRPLQSRFIAVAPRNRVAHYQHVIVREGRSRRDVMVMSRQFLSHIEVPDKTESGKKMDPRDKRLLERAADDAEVRDGLRDAARLSSERELELQQANAVIERLNRLVIAVLSKTTGQQYLTPDAWWQWWLDESDRVQNSKRTTFAHQYTSKMVWYGDRSYPQYPQYDPSKPRAKPTRIWRNVRPTRVIPFSISCFAAGTLVWTNDGATAIETIKVGDMVLSKDVETGELCYKPVLETTVRPPSPLVTFKAGADTFLASRGHLFWQSGTGWTQARRLQDSMLLHAAAGPVRVTNLAEAPAQPTYNLVVADFNTYFVGEEKVLTHDVTEEEPTDVIVPGLNAD